MKGLFSNLKMMLAIVVAAVMFASCSDEQNELLNLVPKTTKFVALVNPLDLAKKADLQEFKARSIDDDAMKTIKDFFTGDLGVDPAAVILFEHKRNIWALFNVSDEAKLKSAFKKDPVSIDGFTVIKDGRDRYIFKDGLGLLAFSWSGENEDAVDVASQFLKLKDGESVTSIEGFAKNMAGADINIYGNMNAIFDEAKGEMPAGMDVSKAPYFDLVKDASLYATIDFEKEDLVVSSKVIDKEGNDVWSKIDQKDIDSGILKYLYGNSAMVLAVNIPQNYLEYASSMVASQIGSDPMTSGIVNALLSNLDGNIAIGATLDNLQNYYANNYVAVLKLKPDAEKQIKSVVNASFAGMISPDGKGEYNFPVDSRFNVKVGFKDSYMYVTNTALPTGETFDKSDNAKKITGKSGAMFVDFSSGTVLSGMLTMVAGHSISGYFYTYSERNGENKMILHVDNDEEKNILTYFLKMLDKKN